MKETRIKLDPGINCSLSVASLNQREREYNEKRESVSQCISLSFRRKVFGESMSFKLMLVRVLSNLIPVY